MVGNQQINSSVGTSHPRNRQETLWPIFCWWISVTVTKLVVSFRLKNWVLRFVKSGHNPKQLPPCASVWKRITLSESPMTSVQLWGWLITLSFTFYWQISGFIRIITLTWSFATPVTMIIPRDRNRPTVCASISHSCNFLLPQPYHVAQYQDPAVTNPNKLNFPPLSTNLNLRQLEKRFSFEASVAAVVEAPPGSQHTWRLLAADCGR